MLFLVIDDDELSRELLAMLLQSEGHQVEVAASGEEALARLSRRPDGTFFAPDVVLSDMQMSGVSGSELASLLRPVTREQTLLFAMSGSQPAAPQLEGFDGFLLKPFTMEELAAALNQEKQPHETDAAPAPDDPSHDKETLPALNELIYGQLAKSMTTVQLGQIYTLCLSDARARIARMRELARAGDDAGYRREAHTVKGGCGLIGATEISRFAETAEGRGINTAGSADSDHGASSTEALLNRFSAACDKLERILGERA